MWVDMLEHEARGRALRFETSHSAACGIVFVFSCNSSHTACLLARSWQCAWIRYGLRICGLRQCTCKLGWERVCRNFPASGENVTYVGTVSPTGHGIGLHAPLSNHCCSHMLPHLLVTLAERIIRAHAVEVWRWLRGEEVRAVATASCYTCLLSYFPLLLTYWLIQSPNVTTTSNVFWA